MALAIVRPRGEIDGFQEFDVDTGTSPFWAWSIGTGSDRHEGLPVLAGRVRTSPLLGPLDPSSRGRVVLRVPSDAFTGQHHHLQVVSFRDQDLRGPAPSDVVDLPWRWTRPERPGASPDGQEEPMTAAPTLTRAASNATTAAARGAAPLSHAQFLDALAGIIGQLLPVVRQALPVVEQILPVLRGDKTPPAPAPGSQTPPAGSTTQPTQPTPPAGTPAPPGTPAPDLTQLLGQLLAQIQEGGTQRPWATQSSVPHYSHAQIAPLLAALPALMPLLQQVLTPQTVQSLISVADPNKLLQTVTGALMQAAQAGQVATDHLHQHLRELNPGLGDDVLIPLLAGLSFSAQENARWPRHTRSRLVRITVPDLAPVDLGGYPQVAFRHGESITVPLAVDTPRPIRRATLRACLKHAGSLRPVAHRTYRFERVEAGRVEQPVVLPPAVTTALVAGEEYLLDLTLTWKGRSGPIGASTSQLVRIVGDAVFDSLDSGGAPVRLDDIDRDRDWWHRAWTGTLDDTSSRITADLEYELRLGGAGEHRNRRIESDVRLDAGTGRRREGTIRAALEVSLDELSRLAARLTGAGFDDATMAALRAPGFAAAFDRSAHCVLRIHGRRGAQFAVWVWPEVKIHKAFVLHPGRVSNETGQVLTFETRAVPVPVPGLVHVLTARSG